jgi:transcriptional regulator with XRE-family HTH domain
MPIGEFLAAARHRAGLSVAQVSERTRIRETIISSIESGDYSACGGDFYARGHIRAIAKAVGADAEPLIREYDSLHRAPGAVSAVSLEELLSASAQVPPRGRARLPAVGGVAAAAWMSAWSRVNLAAVRDLAAQTYRSLGRRLNWQPVLALALVAAVAGFGLYRVLSGVPREAVAAPPAAWAGQAQQHARPDSGFPAGHAAPGAVRSRPGAHSRATLRRSVLVAAIPAGSHNDLRSARGRPAHRPGVQRPLRHARPHHGPGHHGHGHHGHGHHGHGRA